MTPQHDVNFEEKTWQLVLNRLDSIEIKIDDNNKNTNAKMDKFMTDNSDKAHICRKEIFAEIKTVNEKLEKKVDKEEFIKVRDIVYKGVGGLAVLMAVIGIVLKFA